VDISTRYCGNPKVPKIGGKLEVRGGIEPPYADLQSAASPLCHRTAGAGLDWKSAEICRFAAHYLLAGLPEVIQIDPS
jgi:hypothetical protein